MYEILNAYGKRHLIKIPQQNRVDETGKKKLSLTRPNKETTIEEAIRRYQPDGNRQIRAYYEQQGLELPNFAKMDRLEQLMLLATVTQERKKLEEESERKKKETQRIIDFENGKKIGEGKNKKTNEGPNTVS